MHGTVICTICATLQAGRRHKWLSYGHRIGSGESKRTDSILVVARPRPPSTRPLWPLFTGVRGSGILRSLYTGCCIIAPSETAIRLARKSWVGRTDHNVWGLG